MECSLRDLRKKKLFSQNELSSLMGWKNMKLSFVENGKSKLEFSEAKALSEVLGIDLNELYVAYSNSRKKENGEL